MISVFPAERARLAQFLARLCGDAFIAEDLAQETLTEAWLNRHKLTQPQGYQKWLTAIAYNIYRRWRRQRSIEADRYTALDVELAAEETPPEIEIERSELAHLLDEAIALLPPETRAVFIARYLEGQSQERVARQLKTTGNAVAVRLHRGKLTLRRLLAAEFDRQTDGEWQETRIWCGQCGVRHFLGRFNPATEEFILRCPACDLDLERPAFANKGSHLGIFSGVKGFKAALKRLLNYIDQAYPQAAQQRLMNCLVCGRQSPVQLHFPQDWPESVRQQPALYSRCECGAERYTALSGLAIASPAGRRFWQRHPRSHILPLRPINYDSRPALVVGFESLRDAARLEVVYDRDTYRLLGHHGDE